MKIKKHICKILSVVILAGAILPGVIDNTLAVSAPKIILKLSKKESYFLTDTEYVHRKKMLRGYTIVSQTLENAQFQEFVKFCGDTPEAMDSALLLFILHCIDKYDGGHCKKQIESAKSRLLADIKGLRSTEEFRNDRFYSARFDAWFGANTATICKRLQDMMISSVGSPRQSKRCSPIIKIKEEML